MISLKFITMYSLLLLAVLFSGTAFSSPFRTAPAEQKILPVEHEIRTRILTEYTRWEGVKYRLGGTSRKGIDCSSLMQEIFHAAFDDMLSTRLPRTTSGQIGHGIRATRSDLRPGDLVFFHMSAAERHVGVYIGEDRFIHASTSQGVKISSLQNDYWVKRYTTARRILS
ncbi:glycoside hydrolase [Enterobacteriaceae bacterium 89]|nr:glycoside hydrolase [Enterobacteriaceae bacterium 89]